MVTAITNKLLPEIVAWQKRPLSTVYPIVYIDAIVFNMRENNVIRKAAAYVILGINEEGRKEVLSITIGENESAKFWLSVLNELKNRESAEKYRLETELKNAKEVAAKINGKTVKLTAKAGQGGKIFGSVTAKEVAESISRQFGVSVDKRKVSMEDIKSFGTFSAEVKVYNGVNATVYVSVGEE